MNMLDSLAQDQIFTMTKRVAQPEEARWNAQHATFANMQVEQIKDALGDPSRITPLAAHAQFIGQFPYMWQCNVDPKSFKNVLKRLYPNIVYGTDSSCVISADIGMETDSELFSAKLSGGALSSEAKQDPGLPMLVIPSTLSMEMFGCPFMGFGQQYFIDFGTNTTLDSFYACVGVTHNLSPGQYTTSAKLVPMDSYGRYRSITTEASKLRARMITNLEPVAGSGKVWDEAANNWRDAKPGETPELVTLGSPKPKK